MARTIAEAITPMADRRLALFGHSMGAVVALETARALEVAGVEVTHLFASGSRNAPLPENSESFSEDPTALAQQLVRLGGTDADMVEDPVFQELVMPYILGDGRMFHEYTMSAQPVLNCPVTTISGVEDDDADLRPWETLTRGGFAERSVAGDHFYLVEAPPFSIVGDALTTSADRKDR
jgi:pyochelin biosynthetic protein PchC